MNAENILHFLYKFNSNKLVISKAKFSKTIFFKDKTLMERGLYKKLKNDLNEKIKIRSKSSK